MISPTNGPLRVLMVMTSLNRGGMETYTMNIYRAIDRNRIQFDFLLHRDEEGAYEDEAVSLGAKIYRIRHQNPLDPLYWRALDDFFTKHTYEVVYAQLDCLSALPLAVAKRHGVPIRIAHSHSSSQDHDYKYPLKLACKPFIKSVATDLFACGDEAGKWMFGTNNFRIIRNAIDVAAYSFDVTQRLRVRQKLDILRAVPVIGHVGRFSPVKNQSFILEVFSEFLKDEPDAVLLLVGDGDTKQDIENKAFELGVSDSVRFLGDRSDVPDLMCAMDIFIMPSLYEGLPMVLVEAQASGLPCLISDAIPPDCEIISRLIHRCKLKNDAPAWSKMIQKIFSLQENRESCANEVRQAGFDIFATAEMLQDQYFSRRNMAR